MSEMRLGAIESKFADIIWDNEPISSTELVKICEKEFNWKKSTTYTVLKRLSNKGLFVSNNGIVTSLISKEELQSVQSHNFVRETFQGSLPAFLTAFTSRNALTKDELAYLKKLVNEYEEE